MAKNEERRLTESSLFLRKKAAFSGANLFIFGRLLYFTVLVDMETLSKIDCIYSSTLKGLARFNPVAIAPF